MCRRTIHGQGGQAAAELVAVVPIVVALTLAVAQLALIGFALWSATDAARAGARAGLVGADAERVARAAVPSLLGARASAGGSRVRVEVHPPTLLPGLKMPDVTGIAGLDPAAGDG